MGDIKGYFLADGKMILSQGHIPEYVKYTDAKSLEDRIAELEKSKLEYMNAMVKERKRHNDRDMSDMSTQEKIRNYFEEWAKLLRIRTSHEKWWDITEKEQFERIKERILLLKVTEMKYDSLQTAHSNREVDIDSQSKLITEIMEWIDNKYEYYDNRHSDVEYAIFLILEEFKEQFEQKAKAIKDK